MNPYANQKSETSVRAGPRSDTCGKLWNRERQAEKQGIVAERRAIKKAARQHLKDELLRELNEAD